MYEDISLKALRDSAKGHKKTILKELCKLKGESFLAKNLKQKDFENLETRIDAMNVSPSSKRVYRSSLKQIHDDVFREGSSTPQKVVSQQKRELEDAFNELSGCEFRQTDSRRQIICRHKNPLIKINNLTPQTCTLCEKLLEEMSQLEKMLGVKPRLREYKALKIIKHKYELKHAEVESLTKTTDYLKTELDKKFRQERDFRNNRNKNEELERELKAERAEKQRLFEESTKNKAEIESLKRTLSERVTQIQQFKIPCPNTNSRVSLSQCLTCNDFVTCPEYGKLVYAED